MYYIWIICVLYMYNICIIYIYIFIYIYLFIYMYIYIVVVITTKQKAEQYLGWCQNSLARPLRYFSSLRSSTFSMGIASNKHAHVSVRFLPLLLPHPCGGLCLRFLPCFPHPLAACQLHHKWHEVYVPSTSPVRPEYVPMAAFLDIFLFHRAGLVCLSAHPVCHSALH